MNDLEQFKALLDDWGVGYSVTFAVTSEGLQGTTIFPLIGPDGHQRYDFDGRGKVTMFAGMPVTR